VIDRVVDSLEAQRGNPDIEGVTCEVPRSQPAEQPSSLKGFQPTTARPPDEEMLEGQGGLYEQIEKQEGRRIIIAAFGQNRPGVVAALTSVLAENKGNIEDISQKIMQEFFSMIMIVDISACPLDFQSLTDKIKATEAQLGYKVYVMHEDIFRYMHRI
jgi:ACT domain-containing protein